MKQSNLAWYVGEVRKIPILSKEEQEDLFYRIREGDEEARTALVTSNLAWVIGLTRKYHLDPIREDLIASGNLGLVESIKTWNPEKGSFLSYSKWYILKEIYDCLGFYDDIFTIHRNSRNELWRIRKAERYLMAKLRRKPNPEEVVDYLMQGDEKKRKSLERMIKFSEVDVTSLDKEIDEDRDLSAIIFGADEEELIGRLHNVSLRNIFEQAYSVLNERERCCCTMYYLEGKTLHEIGKILGVTRQRVNQLVKKGIKKLRKVLVYDEDTKELRFKPFLNS